MTEFTIGEHTYRAAKLDAFKQLHLSRKVAPIIPTLIPVFAKLSGAKDSNPLSGDLAGLAGLLEPFAEGLANMPDESAEYVLGTCLAVVQRKQGKTWAPVWSERNSVCMFDDLDLGVMIQLAIHIMRDSLGPFLAGLLSTSGAAKA
ncbi:phage tail assembly chaperone [Pseudomonas sp.]|uniref:phage tail assembly chaperone n=1 Tax=Pseudomonas sp. TaxID=306 RepID=UPI00258B9A30|nr:hypothetical protein [Pseudomonas sp.]